MTTVWIVHLDAPEALTPERLSWLDQAERDRAARFYSTALADRWRVAHIALRGILASALRCDPAAVRFARDANGKPMFAEPPSAPVSFNLSHAADIALVAVANGQAVGVDVEQLRPVPEMEGVAASHFAPEEQAALWQAPEPERLVTFYRIWTRKESYVKATGVGIGPALARFSVTAGAATPRLLYAHDTPDLLWSLHDVRVPETYLGALCIAGPAEPVRLRSWQPD